MVAINDFLHTPFFSFGIILFIYGLLIGFGAFVRALLTRMSGEERDEAAPARMSGTAEEHPIRKAA